MPGIVRQSKHKVYRLTSPSGRVYIGYTRTKMRNRLWAHDRDARNGAIRPICHAIRKHGIENFKVKILGRFKSKTEALAYEISMIEKYQSNVKGKGYNASEGGECFPTWAIGAFWLVGKTKKQIRTINKKKGRAGKENGFYGRTHDKEAMSRAVETRRLNGSYNTENMGQNIAVKYKNQTFPNKISMRKALGMGRKLQEELIASGTIKILSKVNHARHS